MGQAANLGGAAELPILAPGGRHVPRVYGPTRDGIRYNAFGNAMPTRSTARTGGPDTGGRHAQDTRSQEPQIRGDSGGVGVQPERNRQYGREGPVVDGVHTAGDVNMAKGTEVSQARNSTTPANPPMAIFETRATASTDSFTAAGRQFVSSNNFEGKKANHQGE